MRGVIIHAPKDLRIEDVAPEPLGPRDVRVRIEAGGICGSDLHYYHHGGFGTVRLRAADGARARDRRHRRRRRRRGLRRGARHARRGQSEPGLAMPAAIAAPASTTTAST